MLGFGSIAEAPTGAESASTAPTSGGGDTGNGGSSYPRVNLSFVIRTGGASANVSDLRWAFFDQATPDLFMNPMARGVGATTGANGEFTIDITGTELTTGQVGFLVVSNTTGVPGASSIAFAGPVTVT